MPGESHKIINTTKLTPSSKSAAIDSSLQIRVVMGLMAENFIFYD